MTQLLPLIGIFVMLTAAVLLLLGVAACIQSPSRALRLAGSTTLGTYVSTKHPTLYPQVTLQQSITWSQVLHYYFTLPLAVLQPHFSKMQSAVGNSGVTLTIQMLLLLLLPIVFQLTIGAAFHKLLMLQFRGLFAMANWVTRSYSKAVRSRTHVVKPEPYSAALPPLPRLSSSRDVLSREVSASYPLSPRTPASHIVLSSTNRSNSEVAAPMSYV